MSFGSAGSTSVRDPDDHIARADLLPRERVLGRRDRSPRVLILIDDLHRHEPLARIGQRDRHRPGVEVEHHRRIERVAVHPDDGLVVDRRQFAVVLELSEAALLQRDRAEVQSVSARMKFSTVTGTGCPPAAGPARCAMPCAARKSV